MKEKERLEHQNQQLCVQIKKLQAEIKRSTEKQKQEIDVLRKICTPGQIAKLTSSTNSRIRWSSEDIMSAIGLRALSPKAYKYLRNVKKVPLPCPSTLQNWTAKFNVSCGILTDVLKIMSSKGNDYQLQKN